MKRYRRKSRLLAVLSVLMLVAGACSQRDDDDDGGGGGGGGGGGDDTESAIPTEDCRSDPTVPIEGDTIRLVSSYPQSGLVATFSLIGVGWQSYFTMINEQGGVEIDGQSYQIEWETADDQYEAARTSTNIRELVGQDGSNAFAAFSVVGTANNVGIRDFLGDLCVPNLFAATGSPAWGNPDYPWTLGSTLSPYTVESQVFVDHLAESNPDARIAMLVQDDDFGQAYREGVETAIEGTDMEVVGVETYEAGSGETQAQVTSLADSGADVFFNGGTLLACPNALEQAESAGWEREVTWVSSTCLSKTLTGIAGPAADGVLSIGNLKDPQDPAFADDAAVAEYREQVDAYVAAEGIENVDSGNTIVGYGWTQAAAFVAALEQAEAPTRLAVMESVRNLEIGDDVGLMLPGATATTGEDDPYFGENVNLVTYVYDADDNVRHFERVNEEVIDFEGQTADITPEGLITG